ncbi:MAG: tetratricopeptide repeat protein, partial [Terriglobales bacterium]
HAYYFARQYDRAIEQQKKILELNPNYFPAHWRLGSVYVAKAMYNEAIAEYQTAIRIQSSLPLIAALGHAYARAGNEREALKIVDELKPASEQSLVSGYDIALIYAALGEEDQAFAWLDKAYEQRAGKLVMVRVDPRLDPLRSDPRFKDLTRRVGLPQ